MIPDDLRTALRSLRATPGLTVVAFALLAVGLAASTIVFSVVDTVVFRRLPFDQPDRLVSISTPLSRNLASGIQVAGPDFFAWRDRQDVLSSLAAVTFSPAFTIKDAPGSAPIQAKSVTADLFDVLRVAPALGRQFTWDNEVAGRDRVALIGYDVWQRQFGGDPSVVGRTVEFTRGALEIVGVMPRGFTYPVGLVQPVEMWVPWVPRPNDRLPEYPGRSWMLEVVGRIKDGVTFDQARAQLQQIYTTLQTEDARFLGERTIVTTSLADALVGSVRPWMLLLLTAVGVLLLITCVNVANLLLARSITRQRDGAIRTALGATRGRLVRVMLLESALLSAGATMAGVLIAAWGVALAKANLPAGIPRATAIALDLHVILIAAAAGAATAMLIGLLPALRASRGDLASLLGATTRSQTGSGTRWRAALIVSEIALVVTMLVGSGLVLLSFVRLVTLDLGMSYERVTAFDVRVPTQKIEPTNQRMPPLDHVRMNDLFERVRAVPGVLAAALITDGVPLAFGGASYSIEVPGRGKFDGPDAANHHGVSGGYFAAMRIPVLYGREYDDTDLDGSAPVIMVNDAAARRYFGVANPVGQQMRFWGDRTVVGVVANVRMHGPEADVAPEIYMPLAQAASNYQTLLVRAAARAGNVQPAIQAAIGPELPAQPQAQRVQSLDELFRGLTARRRFTMSVMTMVGAGALVLAILGIYGVMTSIVAQRTREIGVRMALGASRAAVLRSVVVRALTYVLAGSAIGLALAWTIARVVQSLLFHVETHDPIVYVAVTLTLALAGVAAAWLPARRAARVDPVVALRTE
ncbi:MAG TPA: ABC transporter permease [Vicinamibacterales bacterium]|nr:ABC transporter permease [Vicinamibacterales bacterium]